MKIKIALALIITCICDISAQQNKKEFIRKNNIKTQKILASEFENKKITIQLISVIEYNSFGNELLYTSYNEDNSIRLKYVENYSKNGLKRTTKKIDENGNLERTFTTIRDRIKRSYLKIELNKEGDTLVHQLKYVNNKKRDSILFNLKNDKRIIIHQWFYNNDGKLNSEKIFEPETGELLSTKRFKYIQKKNCLMTKNFQNKLLAKKCTKKNEVIEKTLFNGFARIYGIKIPYEKNGEKITTYLENGLIDKIVHYSKKGKIFATLEYTYE